MLQGFKLRVEGRRIMGSTFEGSGLKGAFRIEGGQYDLYQSLRAVLAAVLLLGADRSFTAITPRHTPPEP